jgi:hypothetical protein
MRETAIGILLAFGGPVAMLVLGRAMNRVSQRVWRVAAWSCVVVGLAIALLSDPIYSRLISHALNSPFTVVTISLSVAILVTASIAMLIYGWPFPKDFEVDLTEVALGAGEITTPLGQTSKGSFCILLATVRNRGEPRAVEGFRLKVTFSDGTTMFGEGQHIPDELTMPLLSGVSQTVYGQDHLGEKTRDLIPTGGFVRGRMIYFLRDVDINNLAASNTVIQFEMKDTFGRIHSAERTIKAVAIAGPFLKYPGLK